MSTGPLTLASVDEAHASLQVIAREIAALKIFSAPATRARLKGEVEKRRADALAFIEDAKKFDIELAPMGGAELSQRIAGILARQDGLRMELSVVAFATFWPMLVLAQAAARQVEPRLLEVARALQLSPAERFAKIVLPAVVPRLFVALPRRSKTAIIQRCRELGLRPRSGSAWTAEETRILASRWSEVGQRTLLDALPGRSWMAIHSATASNQTTSG